MKSFQRTIKYTLWVAILVFFASSCSVSKFLPEGATLLDHVALVSDSANFDPSTMEGYIRQHPNSKWFSLFKAPLGIYCLSGKDSTKRVNRFIRKLGEKPVLFSEDIARKTQTDILSAVQNLGYLNASVDLIQQQKGRNTRLIYYISPGTRYTVRNLQKQIQDSAIDSLLSTSDNESYLSEGMNFDLNILQSERSRINSLLQNRGYYRFNNEYIHYEADTTVGNQQVDLLMQLRPYRVVNNDTIPHNVFRIGKVSFPVDENAGTRLKIRPKVLYGANELKTGDLYSEDKVQKTYSRLMRLGSVMGANIRFEPDKEDSTLLHTNIVLAPGKPNSVNLELEGTNSAGDFGAAVSTSYQNRNLFHGGELFSITLRGAYEAIKGLNGYSDQDYIEYSVETGITFPDFKFPFLSSKFRRLAQATSEVTLMFD